MTLDALNAALAGFRGAAASYPFDAHTRVYKVGGKMFALVAEEKTPTQVTLKCDPDLAEELRRQYPGTVTPGYYMHKRHWNTVTLDPCDTLPVSDDDLRDFLAHSYDLVFRALPRATRETISGSQEGDRAASPINNPFSSTV